MSKKMTVKDMAYRLAVATGQSETLHARQVRHWAQHGLFGFEDLERSGDSRTASYFYNDRHLAAARLYALFTAMGWNIDQLGKVSRLIKNIGQDDAPKIDIGGAWKIERNGLKVVVDAAKAGDFDWCFGVYSDERGTVHGGSMMRASATGPSELRHSFAPVFTVIALGPLFRRLFTPDAGGEA
ncbi:hypothetical protein H1W37_03765 [Stappia taiwanensis]|uniref:HTH merR-type domain-containing protein n=1 Tax=Stappia taiwanensis TaxID=992267 RepID=A0A838XUL5_9HYPH|nr:hypothetical protein [Stappia taiwanensis]MBA4610754.1 hypothetical protein [Stappia taiwanensis]